MCNSYPIFRLGQTLDLSFQADDSSPQSLASADAASVGEGLYRTADIAMAQVATMVRSEFKFAVEKIDDKRSLSYAQGVVVDFANYTITSEQFVHRVRLSFTVCQFGSRSKLWFRSQCAEIKRGGGFEEAQEFVLEDLQAFLDEAKVLGEATLPLMLAHYRDVIAGHMTGREDGPVRLKPKNEFQFLTFDSDRHEVGDLFDQLQMGDRFTNVLLEAPMIAETRKPHPMVLATQLGLGAGEVEVLVERIRDQDVKIFGAVNKFDSPGLFLRHRPTNSAVPREAFFGVAYREQNEGFDFNRSPASSLSAQIIPGIVNAV